MKHALRLRLIGSWVLVLIDFSGPGCGRPFITPVGRNSKRNLRRSRLAAAPAARQKHVLSRL